MRVLQTAWFVAFVVLGAAVSLSAATSAIAQDSNPQRDFRALHHWASTGQQDYIPGELAVLLHLNKGEANVPTKRWSLVQKRPSDKVVLKRYVADITEQWGSGLILLSQMIEGDNPDSTLSYLFDKNGRIVRVFELKLDRTVVEIRDSSWDALGYDIWKIFIRRIPPEHYDK